MKLTQLYKMQLQLDTHIQQLHNVTYEDTLNKRVMAFLVELGEFANETRCFKFWSNKGPSLRNVILEEYVDGIHFLLSIGLALHYNIDDEIIVIEDELDMTKKFLNVYKEASNLLDNLDIDHYKHLFSEFLGLGKLLGFNYDDIYTAYLDKNKENFNRQANNY